MMNVEHSEELLARETEILGENLSQHYFVHHKSHAMKSARTRAAAVGSRRLTTRAMVPPLSGHFTSLTTRNPSYHSAQFLPSSQLLQKHPN
jgi:hypothetical protein